MWLPWSLVALVAIAGTCVSGSVLAKRGTAIHVIPKRGMEGRRQHFCWKELQELPRGRAVGLGSLQWWWEAQLAWPGAIDNSPTICPAASAQPCPGLRSSLPPPPASVFPGGGQVNCSTPSGSLLTSLLQT